jgi:AraC-like DNA-binding protein
VNRADVLLEAWQHTCSDNQRALVVPDGCRDLIAWALPGQPTQWKITPLMDQAVWVPGAKGKRYQGFRLKPGTAIESLRLLKSLQNIDPEDATRVLERLHSFASQDQRVNDALLAIAEETRLVPARQRLGIGERSLERLMRRVTGRTPTYWRRLARFRQATQDIEGAKPLAQVATDRGFADQAHLNRECRLWMNFTPGELRQQPAALRLLREPGYG